jgi:2'-5' RNA ligase
VISPGSGRAGPRANSEIVPPATIGVALPVPEPFLGELGAYRERLGDPRAHSIVAHITLIPPVRIKDQVHLELVNAHLRQVGASARPFRVELRGSASFRPTSPVVYVPVVRGEEAIRSLEALVRTGPLARNLKFLFHPHVTIAHALPDVRLDEAEEALASYRAEFEVARLGLFVHGADGVWRESREIPFG